MQTLTGLRIRERRRELGITQTDLAKRVGVSPSYLNLIEKNKRRVSGRLLSAIGRALALRLDALDGTAERRLHAQLIALSREPAMADPDLDPDTAAEFIARFPAWARSVARTHQLYAAASEDAQAMADRLAHDPSLAQAVHAMLTEITALRSTAEILVGADEMSLVQRRRFEDIVAEQAHRLSDTCESLARYFDDAVESRRPRAPDVQAEDVLTRHSEVAGRIEELVAPLRSDPETGASPLEAACAEARSAERSTGVAPAPRAQILADAAETLIETALAEELDVLAAAIADEADAETADLIRMELAQRAADALRAPASHFCAVGRACAWRPDAIAAAFDDDRALAARRLACLPDDPDAGAPRAAHVALDVSGGVLERRGALDLLPQARRLDCPNWPVFRRALRLEGAALGRIAIAEIEPRIAVAIARPDDLMVDLIVYDEAPTPDFFPALSDQPPKPVGAGCRLCSHRICAERRCPPALEI